MPPRHDLQGTTTPSGAAPRGGFQGSLGLTDLAQRCLQRLPRAASAVPGGPFQGSTDLRSSEKGSATPRARPPGGPAACCKMAKIGKQPPGRQLFGPFCKSCCGGTHQAGGSARPSSACATAGGIPHFYRRAAGTAAARGAGGGGDAVGDPRIRGNTRYVRESRTYHTKGGRRSARSAGGDT